MTRLLRAEWIKLHTVTMNRVLGIIAVAFPLVVSLLTCWFRSDDGGFIASDVVEVVTGSSFVLALLGGVIAVSTITAEYGFGTIRPTFAATPHRGRVVVAKGIVVVVFVSVLQALVLAVALLGGAALARAHDAVISFDTVPTLWPVLGGTMVFTALMAVFGYALGMIMRSTPVATATLILWPLLAEALIGALIAVIVGNSDALEWMPMRAAFRLMSVEVIFNGPSRLVAGLYFAGFAVGLALLGSWRVQRSDA